MKKIMATALILFSFPVLSSLSFPAEEKIGNENVPSYALFAGQKLDRLGTAIRKKKVIFVDVNVYRANLFGSSALFVRNAAGNVALDSLQAMPIRVLQLKFLRGVNADDIWKSFEAALKKNSVKESPMLTKFKEAIKQGGNVKEGDSVTLTVNKEKGTLICEQGKTRVEIPGNDQFFREVFSIWFGQPADAGLGTMRNAIISGT